VEIAKGAAGACVTIRAMPRVLLALFVLFGAPACQQAEASRNAVTARDRQVAARLDTLDREVAHLKSREKRFARVAGATSSRIAALSRRLDAAVARLGHLRTKLGTINSAAGRAAAAADSAAAQAAELAVRLAVLEKRFEYHLKHDPGSS
jgi:chromosome segregation ATPase